MRSYLYHKLFYLGVHNGSESDTVSVNGVHCEPLCVFRYNNIALDLHTLFTFKYTRIRINN